jgi:NADH-quinone oxidoreductase subunit M
MLVAIMAMYEQVHTTDIRLLMDHAFPLSTQIWLWVAFFISFAVKLPMWPLHTWLPDAYTEAPTTGSVIMMLLKLGAGYGFLRFSLSMLPQASAYFTPAIYILSVVAVIYTSLVTLVQTDMKRLIAYSSVAHMGFVTAGVFSVTTQGVEGALLQLLSQGVITAALFLCVGAIYDRVQTSDIGRLGGLASRMPKYAAIFMVFVLAAAGLPGTSGFVGEFLVLVGLFKAKIWVSVLAASGMVLSAAYMLYLYRRVALGKLVRPDLMGILDMSGREMAVFAPLLVVVLWMGIYPATFLRPMRASVARLVSTVQLAQTEPFGPPLAALANGGTVAVLHRAGTIAIR